MAIEQRDDGVVLTPLGNGVWQAPGARIIDRAGEKKLSIGDDGFARAMSRSTLVDKTMLIADILDSDYTCMLFCRPRRFGKTLNMTMLKAFFELPAGRSANKDAADLFVGTEIWDAADGKYRAHQGSYPVVHISFNTVKRLDWPSSFSAIKTLVEMEYARHDYLSESDALSQYEQEYFRRIASGAASVGEFNDSLMRLVRVLSAHHRRPVVLLIDEYDAPVMAGYTYGYYVEVTTFLKAWLTGALKDGGAALAFACLTGVQRISKESIFSDLNNLKVSTSLSTEFDERYGFTDAEVSALSAYLGLTGHMDEARSWYDGYRFGSMNVYNPWSVLNYLNSGCKPGVYWANTSSNDVVAEAVRSADAVRLDDLYRLMEPGGYVISSLDLGIIFPDIGIRQDALWSMLYLAGYLTTDLTDAPDDDLTVRPLRIPNNEIRHIYRREIVGRFMNTAGGERTMLGFRRALCEGDSGALQSELGRMVRDAASSLDLVSENSCHLLMLGLCFGISGYADPSSNREAGYGRYDIRLEPVDIRPGSIEAFSALKERPRVTIEIKFVKGDASAGELGRLARAALDQIALKGYDVDPLPSAASGRLRWGIAFSGKHVVALSETAE